MKHKEPVAILLIGVLLSGLISAGAADAGSVSDPLIALNWLKKTFIPNTVSQADEHIKDRLDGIGDDLISANGEGRETRVKRSDILWLESGSSLTPLAGTLSVLPVTEGTVVDLTAGQEVPAVGGNVVNNHRYLAAEKTRAAFSVESDTAVVRLNGICQLISSEETDYNAMADALKAMGLFQGSDRAYGSGYDLEFAPTRIQGLIMFLRLLGEEQTALNDSGGTVTFADVPDWALPYAAYAYAKGYTKGQSLDDQQRVIFGSNDPLASRDYMTFLLRALGYSDEKDFQWLTAVEDGQRLGVLTSGEVKLLTEKEFLRAQVVYLSYMALSAKVAGGNSTLLDRLTAAGVVNAATAGSAMSNLTGKRL